MADLTLLVTHTDIDDVETELEDPDNGLRVTRAELEGKVYEHSEAGSDWLHGTFRTHSRLAERRSILGVRVYADTMGQLKTRRDNLLELFDQDSYKLTFLIEGQTWEIWNECGPADMELDDSSNARYGLMAPKPLRSYLFSIPHAPI